VLLSRVKNCFGTDDFIRVPLPAATIITLVDFNVITSLENYHCVAITEEAIFLFYRNVVGFHD